MAIVIEGLETPKNCYRCLLNKSLTGGGFCRVKKKCVPNPATRPDWCPITNIPTDKENENHG